MDYDLLTINSQINSEVMDKVLKIPRTTKADRLVIIIETSGGSPFVAYRTMHHLNGLYQSVDVVVPNMAMSAGTLMSLGGDTIYMFEGSSLGPLDLQIAHPSDGGQISSIDITQSIYTLFSLHETLAMQLYKQAARKMELAKNIAAEVAHKSATELLKPIIDKIDPYHLQSSFRSGSIGQKYARILLLSRMMKDDYKQANATSEMLASDYQMHSYAITMEEADIHLNLSVANITDLDIYNEIEAILYSLPEGVQYKQIRSPRRGRPKKVNQSEELNSDATKE
jgi:ATP-dependent protease ClpP protease subunit